MADAMWEMSASKVRRRWSREAKRRIVAASRAPGAGVGEVAARYGVSPSLLSVWRGQVGEQPPPASAAASFIPVRIVEAAAPAAGHRLDATASDAADGACLRITLPDGTRLHISHAAQLPLLHGVLGVLRG
jgi:transposase-like protein